MPHFSVVVGFVILRFAKSIMFNFFFCVIMAPFNVPNNFCFKFFFSNQGNNVKRSFAPSHLLSYCLFPSLLILLDRMKHPKYIYIHIYIKVSEVKVLHYATKKTLPKVHFLCVFLEP